MQIANNIPLPCNLNTLTVYTDLSKLMQPHSAWWWFCNKTEILQCQPFLVFNSSIEFTRCIFSEYVFTSLLKDLMAQWLVKMCQNFGDHFLVCFHARQYFAQSLKRCLSKFNSVKYNSQLYIRYMMAKKYGERDVDLPLLNRKKIIRTFKIIKWRKVPAIYWPVGKKIPPVTQRYLQFQHVKLFKKFTL